MDRFARALLAVLSDHQGEDQAVTVSELQQRLGTSSRKIRRTVARLVTDRHIPIASTVHPPYGFYRITDAAEARACLDQYRARIRSLGRRAKSLQRVMEQRVGRDLQQEWMFDEPSTR